MLKMELETSYQVQTVRLAFNPIEEFIDFKQGRVIAIREVELLSQYLESFGFEFVSLGPLRTPDYFEYAADIVAVSKCINLSVSMDDRAFDSDASLLCAQAVLSVGAVDPNNSFRFAIAANVKSGTPFFPVAFFESNETKRFSVGLETTDLLENVWNKQDWASMPTGKVLTAFKEELVREYRETLMPLQKLCLATNSSVQFQGIDASMNPEAVYNQTETGINIGVLYKKLLTILSGDSKYFGDSGSMTISYLITSSIHEASLGIALCGYSGLMLPLLEDKGLAEAAIKGRCGVNTLLLNSCVCGVGIDTVPISSTDVTDKTISMVILDLVSLSCKWAKPLSCRFLPTAGKSGELTQISDNPFLCNSRILPLV